MQARPLKVNKLEKELLVLIKENSIDIKPNNISNAIKDNNDRLYYYLTLIEDYSTNEKIKEYKRLSQNDKVYLYLEAKYVINYLSSCNNEKALDKLHTYEKLLVSLEETKEVKMYCLLMDDKNIMLYNKIRAIVKELHKKERRLSNYNNEIKRA